MADTIDTIAETTPEPQGITICHLNHDCLEKIWSYLNLTDLVNVAESNVYLAISACNLFLLKHSTVKYDCFDPKMSDETFCLLLDHFGKYIKKLHVGFSVESNRDRILFGAIIKTCKTTVNELTFRGMHKGIILDQPFPKVTKLKLFNDMGHFTVHRSILRLDAWFPNLNSLEIQSILKFWKKFIITPYKSLEQFTIFNFPEDDTMDHAEKLAKFLVANPQLTHLAMDEISEVNMQTFLSYAPKQLPNIKCLQAVSPHPYPNGSIEFTNLRELKLSFYRDKMGNFEKLPSTLEHLELRVPELTSNALNSILRCKQTLKKLSLIPSAAIKVEQLNKIAVEMQALTELYYYQNFYTFSGSKIPSGFDQLFLSDNQLKTIHLLYEISIFDAGDPYYKGQIENANEFLKPINNCSKFYWKMSHKLCRSNYYRNRMLFISFLQISFQKTTIFLQKK